MDKKAIIIGSGFGGLATAIRLQALGFKTTIYEKNSKVGGHANQFKEKGYVFDMGPSIITEPYMFDDLFKLNNESFSDYLELIEMDPYYRIYFHDKSYIDYSGDSELMKNQLRKFNTDDAKSYDRFMNYSKKLYKMVIQDGVGAEPFETWSDFLKFLPKGIKSNAFFPSYAFVSRYFKDERSRFTFSFHPLFIGGNPFTSPSIFLMLPYLEKFGKVWFTKGGMYSVVEELEALFKRMGGEVYTNSEVTRINSTKQKVTSIVVDDRKKGEKEISLDILVSNSHFANTYKDLIPESNRKVWTNKKIEKKSYSMGCYLLYLGVKKQYPDLLHHTLIISERYKGLVNDIFKNKILADDFSMYLHAPSRSDSNMAPDGCESLYVLVPVPNLSADIDWNDKLIPFTNRILDFLENDFGLTDLKKNIEVQKTFSPVDFKEQRNNFLGAPWSLEPKMTQVALFRPGNKSEEFENMYLVGASTHPGAGVPGVLLSAVVTEKLIKKDFMDEIR